MKFDRNHPSSVAVFNYQAHSGIEPAVRLTFANQAADAFVVQGQRRCTVSIGSLRLLLSTSVLGPTQNCRGVEFVNAAGGVSAARDSARSKCWRAVRDSAVRSGSQVSRRDARLAHAISGDSPPSDQWEPCLQPEQPTRARSSKHAIRLRHRTGKTGVSRFEEHAAPTVATRLRPPCRWTTSSRRRIYSAGIAHGLRHLTLVLHGRWLGADKLCRLRRTRRQVTPYANACHRASALRRAQGRQRESNGGGGNRTRVPRYFSISFYVCSRVISPLRPVAPTSTGSPDRIRLGNSFNRGRTR